MIGRTTAHLLNVLILISYMILWNFFTRTYVYPAPTVKLPSESRWLRLSLAWFIRISLLIQLPFYCLSLFSFITYFPYDVIFGVKPAKRRFDPESLPLMVVRIVTRGHYRDIIEKSVATHKRLFEQAGVEKYLIQVVTENSLSLTTGTGEKVEEILVPTDYRTPHGTLFKARNLTYAQLHPTKSVKVSHHSS